MSNLLNAIKLDFYTVKSVYRMAALTYLISIIFGFIAQPMVPIFIIMVFSVFFSGMVFSIYEKNHLNKLYGILPLGKSDVVMGRYLYAFFFGVVQAVLAGMIVYVISYVTNTAMDSFALIATLSLSFLYFCFAIGIAFPIYFKFGFSKAYVFTMVPIYLLFIGGVFISKKTSALNNLQRMIQYFSAHQGVILAAGIGLGILLLIISCSISYLVYQRSEL